MILCARSTSRHEQQEHNYFKKTRWTQRSGTRESKMAGCQPGCQHYTRKCSLVTPCCNKVYACRLCHDAEEDHELERKKVNEIQCLQCKRIQGITSRCGECGIKFGFYFCLQCRLFDDQDKGQYHCDLCGVCRTGGRDNFYHCTRCDMCFSKSLRDTHRCIEKSSRSNCPICLEDLHTSLVPCQVLKCGHLLHQTCYRDCLKSGLNLCPLCSTSMV